MGKRALRTIDDLMSFIQTTDHDWSSVVVVGLELRSPEVDDAMLKEEFDRRSSFLGCTLSGALARKIASASALVVPSREGLPFHPFRRSLYDASDLLRGFDARDPASYLQTPDWNCYVAAMDERTKRKRLDLGVDDAVFLRLHDLAIEEALDSYLIPDPVTPGSAKRVVGIMGGHDRERLEKVRNENGASTSNDAPYMQVALLARRLALAGFTVVTGGGPGAMEASNLGAWFAGRTEEQLRAAVRVLERVPKVRPVAEGGHEWNSGEWLAPAFDVVQRYPRDPSDPRTESIGVPTWFYGHEPPNPFATHIAKFFENSVREEGVLGIATHGVIFAEGNAGTVQEIFQDACQNYYATFGDAAPMILLGERYWNRGADEVQGAHGKSAWPLLKQLGEEKGFAHLLLVTDDLDEVLRLISNPMTASAGVTPRPGGPRRRPHSAP